MRSDMVLQRSKNSFKRTMVRSEWVLEARLQGTLKVGGVLGISPAMRKYLTILNAMTRDLLKAAAAK